MKKTKLLVILNLFLDILGLTIVIPAMPNLVHFYNVDYVLISLGLTLYALFGLFSTPILGVLSDKYGRKPVLLYSVIGSLLSYILVVISGNIWVFLFARIINGLSSGNIGALQSILSDISVDHKDRTANLGLFGVVFGIGFIIGPVIGGLALTGGVKMPFVIGMIASLCNVLLVWRVLPETNKLLDKAKKIHFNIIRIFKDIFVSPEKMYYLVFLIINLAIMVYQMTFLLYLNKHFAVSGTMGGYILACFGAVMALNQGLLLKNVWLAKFSYRKLVLMSLIGLIVCYGLAFVFDDLWFVVILVGLSGIFQGIFRPVFQNLILGNNQDVGLINGNIANIGNLTSIVGPLLGGWFLDKDISPFGIAAILMVVALVVWMKFHHKISHNK